MVLHTCACSLLWIASAVQVSDVPRAAAESVGLRSERLGAIEAVVREGLQRGNLPGCVVTIGYKGRVVYREAFGDRQVEPTKEAMTADTIFDLASLTKPIATATSIMKLVEEGRLDPEQPVAHYWPEFAAGGKAEITIKDLLLHQGGLIPDNPLADYLENREVALQKICELKLVAEPGTKFIYTDVGFIVLAEIIERVSGLNVHEFSRRNLFRPLGMSDTTFNPPAEWHSRIAPTEKRGGEAIRGQVHDPRAFAMGGVAGHAGLFSSSADLARFAQMLLDGGTYQGTSIINGETIRHMTQPRSVSSGFRALGWDVKTGYSSNRGDLFTERAFGHGGFTGTAIWIDPGLEMFVIFLSSRLHPDGKGSVNALAGRIATIAASSIDPDFAPPSPNSRVQAGVDVLQENDFAQLNGKRVGLITNQTGIDRFGTSTASVLHRAKNVRLAALFSPEHGMRGELDDAIIGDSRDEETGLPIYSLYGPNRAPTNDSLRDLDVLVFDIQDIGSRFYTYVSTMKNAMLVAARQGVEFVVLDRPNPINGVDVQGPVLDVGEESFVGFHRVPVRHGMTVGELALMVKSDLMLELDLRVIEMSGWDRSSFFDATSLRWVNPSPNMRSLNQALLYPGIGLLETTNLSVGRGTDTPFEILGAPWIDGEHLAEELNATGLDGVRFVPIRFTPASSKFRGVACGGVNLIVTNRAQFQPIDTGLQIAVTLRALYESDWETENLNRLLGSRTVYDAILAGKPRSELSAIFANDLERFKSHRQAFLRY